MRIGFRFVLATLVAVAASTTLGVAAAFADEVTFAGFTNGCYGAGCTPGTTSGAPAVTLLGLTYNSATFNGTTSGGFLAFGNNAATPNVDNLGSFSLNGTPAVYTGQSFTLRVTFTAPPGITGGSSRTFTATLMGSVTANDVGAVNIDFNNSPITLTFSFVNAQGKTVTGSFSFAVNDLSIGAGQTGALSGIITSAAQTVVTAVTFRSISARATHRGNVVRWRTGSELNTLGFHVYRQSGGHRVRVSTNLILAKGHGTYTFLDRSAGRGKTVRYWIQEVGLDGSRAWYGPARVTS